MRGAVAVLLLAAAVPNSSARATEPPPGAASCSGCHARVGATAIPAIYGRNANEIAGMLHGFRDGTRPATLMNRIAKGFTPGELDAIAAWVQAQ